MSDGQNLKITLVVDEASVQKGRALIKDLISDLQKLTESQSKAGGGGNAPGGGFGFSTSNGNVSQEQQKVLTKVNPVGKQLVQGFLDQKQIFKGIADGSAESMRMMNSSLKTAIDFQKRELKDLDEQAKKLVQTYDKLGSSMNEARGPHGSAHGGSREDMADRRTRLEAEHLDIMSKRQEAKKKLADLEDMNSDEDPSSNRARGIRGWLNSSGPGTTPMSIRDLGGLSKLPGMGALGLLASPLGAATALAAGSIATAGVAFNGANNFALIGQGARLNAQNGGPTSYARKLRSGNLSDIRSMADIQSDPSKMREYDSLEGMANAEGDGWFDRAKQFGWNYVKRQTIGWGAAKDAAMRGEFGDAIVNGISGTSSVDAQNRIKNSRREYMDKTTEERGIMEDILSDATSNIHGKMSTMRALGVGDGTKKNGEYRSNAERLLLAYNQFDPGEVVGAVQGIAGSGARGAAYANKTALLNTVLQAQGAGITGASNIAGIMSRGGSQNGVDFVDRMRYIAGSGTDASTVGLIGAYAAQQADQLNMSGFTGQGLLNNLSWGTQGADGNMIARQNIQGQQNIQAQYAGSRDAAQKAQNLLIAQKVAPDAGFYAQRYLANGVSAARMAEIQGGGNFALTEQEQNLGINVGMLRQFANQSNDSRKFRTMAAGFKPGTEGDLFTRALQNGSDAKDYIQKFKKGDKWTDEERTKAISSYATVLSAGDPTKSWSEMLGTSRELLFGASQNAKKIKKGDVAGGSFESDASKDEAKRRETDLDLKDASMKMLKEQQHTAEIYKRLVTSSSNLAITADNITTIIQSFAKNLRDAAGGAPSGNAKTKPKP